MNAQRPLAMVALALSILGFGLGAVALVIHFSAAGSQGAFASFCHVSAELSCDAVLGSPWAKFFGVPIAAWSGLAFIGTAALSVSLLQASSAAERSRRSRLLLTTTVAMSAIALYFLAVSVAAIGVGCPICLSMDATIFALLGAAVILARGLPDAAPGKSLLPWAGGGAALGVFAVVLLYLVQTAGDSIPTGPLSVAQIRRAEPRFYAYYISQPVVALGGIEPDADPGRTLIVVEFLDFECPHCKRAFLDLEETASRGKQDVRVVLRNFPLNKSCNSAVKFEGHEHACLAALASICADRQGRGFEYNRILFENQPNFEPKDLLDYGGGAGLDVKALEACMGSPEAKARLKSDVEAGAAAGVESTPTLFFNGRRIQGGFQNARQFAYALEIERERGNRPPTP